MGADNSDGDEYDHDHDGGDHDEHEHEHGHDHGDGHGHGHGPGHDHDDRHDFTDRIDRLEDPAQYEFLSAEELRTFLDPRPDWTVADLGSGTGFYTDVYAPLVDTVYAVDAYAGMHEAYREKGAPENVEFIEAEFADVPLPDDALDAAVSLRTFHHGFDDALDEVARLLAPGGRLVVLDWSGSGAGERERGPDPGHCYDLADAQALLLEAGFRVVAAHERQETFVVVAALRA